MKEVIDLYAKLVIATFSFIGPSFTLLIPLFYTGIESSKRRHESKMKNLKKIVALELKTELDFTKKIKKTSTEIDKLIEENKTELNLLNPKRQVKRLFISLIFAIILIECYFFQNSHFWTSHSLVCRIIPPILSIISFIFTVKVLWQVFCTIIRIKTEDEEEKKYRSSPLKPKVAFHEDIKTFNILNF